MSVIGSNILAGASGQGGAYNLTNSLRFRSSASAYLNRTPASAGNRQKWTWSGWVKLGLLTPASGWNAIFGAYSDDNNRTFFYTNNNSVSNTFYIFDIASSSTTCTLISTQVLRDVSAWYHLIVSVDTTQATSSDRIKVYLNGNQITSFGTASYPSQNTNFMVNNNVVHYIGASSFSGINLFHDGYLAEVNFIDGQALTPSSFGETSSTTGVWIPKKYSGTYGTNGFYLPFTDNSALTTSSNVGLGKDFSGNSNYWTTNNISITSGSTYDSMTDVPTLTSATAANYCVMSPIASSPLISLTNGNLTAGGTDEASLIGTIGVNSGKWYWEVTVTSGSSTPYLGVSSNSFDKSGVGTNFRLAGISWYGNGNKKAYTATSETSATSNTTGVYGFALDISAGTLDYYFNNSLVLTDTTIPTSGVTLFPLVAHTNSGSNSWNPANFNFGQQPFSYTPPSGFVALNTFNLPTPTIGATASTQAGDYFNAVTWTGTGNSGRSITGVGFQPDFVWAKNRTNAYGHVLFDVLRGAGADKELGSQVTGAEGYASTATYDYLSAFNTDGFTSTWSGSNFAAYFNNSGDNFVAWNWKANGAGVSNTAGTITSTVSASTTAGFSIVTYTGNGTGGATVGHGLGVAPSMYIVKVRSTTESWITYHISIGATNFLALNLDQASTSATAAWNNTAPTSTVFSLGNAGSTNGSGATFVAYCFAAVSGYSAFGSYTGNGSSDGPFVFTGFRPRFIMFKVTSTTNIWIIHDTARDTYNVSGSTLIPNESDAEYSNNQNMDILSNGFKLRSSDGATNQSGQTFIYMAFAESPFKFALGR